MAFKQQSQNTDDRNASRATRARRVLSIANKTKVLEMLDNGETKTSVGHFGGINTSLICTVNKNEEAIRASVWRGTADSLRTIIHSLKCQNRDNGKRWAWLASNRESRMGPPPVGVIG